MNYLKALMLYFNSRTAHYWYRESTGEWICDVTIQLKNEFYWMIRFPHKYKYLCWISELKQLNEHVKEILSYKNVIK